MVITDDGVLRYQLMSIDGKTGKKTVRGGKNGVNSTRHRKRPYWEWHDE